MVVWIRASRLFLRWKLVLHSVVDIPFYEWMKSLSHIMLGARLRFGEFFLLLLSVSWPLAMKLKLKIPDFQISGRMWWWSMDDWQWSWSWRYQIFRISGRIWWWPGLDEWMNEKLGGFGWRNEWLGSEGANRGVETSREANFTFHIPISKFQYHINEYSYYSHNFFYLC